MSSNVYQYSLSVPRKFRNGRIYTGGQTSVETTLINSNSLINETETKATRSAKVVIGFTDTSTPAVENYDTLYNDVYGEFPTVQLFTFPEAGVRWERQEKPIYTIVDGIVTTITFDLSTNETGFIVIS